MNSLYIDHLGPDDAVDAESINKVLIIKLRNIGDVLLMTPLISVLSRELKDGCSIDAVIYKDCKPMLEGNWSIDHLYCVERDKKRKKWGWIDQLRFVRSGKYDLVINLTEGDRGGLISLFSGARWRIGLEHEKNRKWWKSKAYTHLYRTDHQRRHMVEQGLDALRRIGFSIEYGKEPLVLGQSESEWGVPRSNFIDEKLRKSGYVVLHPVSRWMFKGLRLKQIVDIVDGLLQKGIKVVMTSGKDKKEIDFLKQVSAHFPNEVINLGGKLTMNEFAAVIKGAKAMIGADSAPVHMAAALNVPVVVWFGPSNEKVWHPWLTKHRVISMDMDCRPCGFDGCGGGKRSECLMGIKEDQVLDAVNELIKVGGDNS